MWDPPPSLKLELPNCPISLRRRQSPPRPPPWKRLKSNIIAEDEGESAMAMMGGIFALDVTEEKGDGPVTVARIRDQSSGSSFTRNKIRDPRLATSDQPHLGWGVYLPIYHLPHRLKRCVLRAWR